MSPSRDTPTDGERIRCWIYRSHRLSETYLYLLTPLDDPKAAVRLPASLLARLGRLDLALEIELWPQRRLARADATKVIAALEQQGFYLQLPPPRTGSQ